ncbi:MAG: beta-ketoacyl-ACP synthase II [Planctomycetota bacterium]
MAERRVAVTGMGVLTCNAIGVQAYWEACTAGRQGIGPITRFDTSDHLTHFGGEVACSTIDLCDGDKRMARRKDRFVLLALKAAAEAIGMAGFAKDAWSDPFRVATIVSSGIGGLETIQSEHRTLINRGPHRVSPLLVPRMIPDSAAGDISIVYGAKGPNYSSVTACATGSHCIGAGFQHIRHGDCDIAIVGGAEAPITELGVAGFNSIKALSTRNDDPATASRPFDAHRDGFVIAEGAGVLILEELEAAKARGADILGEVVGYGCTGDAFHETQPDPTGDAGAACMEMALRSAGITPDQVGYINAHGTSTKYNDASETAIIKRVFGEQARKMAVSSTKSMIGHTLGAAGGVEAIITLLSLKHGVLTPTINYTTPDPDCDLDYVPNQAREQAVQYALSNNLGFGGHNASLIFKRFDG